MNDELLVLRGIMSQHKWCLFLSSIRETISSSIVSANHSTWEYFITNPLFNFSCIEYKRHG